ncbi:sodium:proton antiporter, partial [Burkholderia multivorans]
LAMTRGRAPQSPPSGVAEVEANWIDPGSAGERGRP